MINGKEFDVVSHKDNRFLHNNLMKLVSRHNAKLSKEGLSRLDKMIRKKHEQQFAVVMFEIELHEIEKEFGAEAGLKLKYKALDLIRPSLQKFGGRELEDVLWIFDDSN